MSNTVSKRIPETVMKKPQQSSPFSGTGPRLRDVGECVMIQRIRSLLGKVNPPAPHGIGDDCAVLPVSTELASRTFGLATVDAVTLGEHFLPDTTPELVGRKLVHRNVSDIAAMGGRPNWALLTLLSGGDLRLEWLDGFMVGLRDAAIQLKMQIIGGDISALPDGLFSAVLCVHGQAVTPILRSTAKAGDSLWVTGTLGGSLVGHHLQFNARVEEGCWLAENVSVSAMMDVSDGIAKDLTALLPADTLAALDINKIPISTAAMEQAQQQRDLALKAAFCDGEDYELLFATPPQTVDWLADWQRQFPHVPVTQIGTITKVPESATSTCKLIDSQTGQALDYFKGYAHFNT
jgi:thiamine-monophosphate kinase